MASTGTESFETGASQGATVTTTGTWFSSITGTASVLTYDGATSAALADGLWCCKVASSANTVTAVRTLPATVGLSYLRLFLTVETRPSAATGIITANSSATVRAGIQLMATGQLRIRNATTTIANSTMALTNGTKYRIEWELNNSGTTQNLRIHTGNSATIDETVTGLFNTGTFDNYRFGALASDTMTYRMDAAATDNATWVGPLAAAGPTVTVWNGTSEVTGTVTVWNGTSEVATTLEVS